MMYCEVLQSELLGPESQIYLQKFDLSVLPANNCEKKSRKSDKGQELARNASTRTPGEEIFDKSAFTLEEIFDKSVFTLEEISKKLEEISKK